MKNLYRSAILILLLTSPFLNIHLFSQCDEIIVNLGNDTVLCEGGVILLDAGIGEIYDWSDGSTGQFITITEPGVYFVNVTNDCGNNDTDSIVIELVPNPVVNVFVPIEEYFCKGETVNLSANVENPVSTIIYEWSIDSNGNPDIDVDTTGTYTVTAMDENGCSSVEEVRVEFQYPNEDEKILLVTFDPTENRNIVVFSKTDGRRTMEYEFYYGANTDNMMTIHDFSYNNLVIDQNTDPTFENKVYNMMVVDSCDNRSQFTIERGHQSIHMIANIDKDGNPLLEWNKYRGFNYDYFYILRGTTEDNAEVIDSVIVRADEIYTYIDQETQGGVSYYYQIQINTPEIVYLENSDTKKASRGPFVHSISNLDDTKSANGIKDAFISELNLKVYPNPFTDQTRINYKLNSDSFVKIQLFNILGERVASLFEGKQNPGIQTIILQPEMYNLSTGMYYIRLETERNSSQSRILIFK